MINFSWCDTIQFRQTTGHQLLAIAKGAWIGEVKKFIAGKCVNPAKKTRAGTFVAIENMSSGKQRLLNPKNCVAIPNVNSFVRKISDNTWHKLTRFACAKQIEQRAPLSLMSNVTRRLAPKVVQLHAVLTVLTEAEVTISQPTAQPVSTAVPTAVPTAQPADDPVQISAAMNANARAAASAAAAANPVPPDRAMNGNDANQVPPATQVSPATATAENSLIGTWVYTHV